MAIISTVGKDVAELYSGYDAQQVGMGLINPNIYATPDYQGKKVQNLVLGGISRIVYAGMEHDNSPLILTMAFESPYQTILAFNLRYVPSQIRRAILKFVLEANRNRIKSNQPILVDYHALKRAVPQSTAIVRRYKNVGIHVRETLPLVEWPKVIEEQSPFQGHYKQFMR